jgi:23S rRNA (pseudouridine1915-N3)-methyltransferase
MKIRLIQIGKTDDKSIQALVDLYHLRIKKYHPFESLIIPDIKNSKNLQAEQQKKLEAELILKQISTTDRVILLDENGLTPDSVGFAKFIEQQALQSVKTLVFIIGGPYGFDQSVYQRANERIALSKMTFPHQLVRVIFAEQLYRANTIIKKEPYHHV